MGGYQMLRRKVAQSVNTKRTTMCRRGLFQVLGALPLGAPEQSAAQIVLCGCPLERLRLARENAERIPESLDSQLYVVRLTIRTQLRIGVAKVQLGARPPFGISLDCVNG